MSTLMRSDSAGSKTTRPGRGVASVVVGALLSFAVMASATRFIPAESAAAGEPPAQPAKPRVKKAPPDSQFSPAQEHAQSPPAIDWKRMVALHGKVVGPGDLPIPGARFYLSADTWTDPVEMGTSDARGAYRFAAPEKSFRMHMDNTPRPQVRAALIVLAEGFAPVWANLPADQHEGWEVMKPEYAHDFHLAADVPIAGRIVDADGKPVTGALVAVGSIDSLADRRWEPMLTAIKAGKPDLLGRRQSNPDSWESSLHRTAWKMREPAVTDAEGRFQIAQIGRDRAIRLVVTGPGIRYASAGILTRDDVADFTQAIRARFPRTLPNGDSQGDAGVQLFGPSPTIEVETARTIGGVVRDAKTREPIPSARVTVVIGASGLSDYTDRHGRYRVVCGDNVSSFWIYASPREHQHYSSAARRFDSGQNLETVADFDLPPGVIVSGRVVEAGTDRPIVSAPRYTCHAPWPGFVVAGFIHYFPLATNAALRGTPTGSYFEAAPNGGTNYSTTVVVGSDGEYRIAVPPGPGVLVVQSMPGMPDFGAYGVWKESDGFHRLFPYLTLSSRAKSDGAPEGDAQNLPGLNGPITLTNYHAYRVINPPADATEMDLTLTVPRAPSRTLRFVDSDGKEIRGVRVEGLLAPPNRMTVVFEGSEAEVLALQPGQRREVVVTSNDGKHAARTRVSTDDPQPRTIRLDSAGSIEGRLLDAATDLPLADYSVTLKYPRDVAGKRERDARWGGQVKTDGNGRFVFRTVIAGRVASLSFTEPAPFMVRPQEHKPESLRRLVLDEGETRDIGDIRIRPSENAKSASKPGN